MSRQNGQLLGELSMINSRPSSSGSSLSGTYRRSLPFLPWVSSLTLGFEAETAAVHGLTRWLTRASFSENNGGPRLVHRIATSTFATWALLMLVPTVFTSAASAIVLLGVVGLAVVALMIWRGQWAYPLVVSVTLKENGELPVP